MYVPISFVFWQQMFYRYMLKYELQSVCKRSAHCKKLKCISCNYLVILTVKQTYKVQYTNNGF